MSESQIFVITDQTPEAQFPPVHEALSDPDGLLAIGGQLTTDRLIDAIQQETTRLEVSHGQGDTADGSGGSSVPEGTAGVPLSGAGAEGVVWTVPKRVGWFPDGSVWEFDGRHAVFRGRTDQHNPTHDDHGREDDGTSDAGEDEQEGEGASDHIDCLPWTAELRRLRRELHLFVVATCS